MALVSLRGLTRDYPMGADTVHALRGIDLDVERGEFLVLMGPSGSGKSTLLNLIGCLDRPTAGSYELDGERVSNFTPRRLAEVRRHKIGFVFQSFHLIPRLTAAENVELPMMFGGVEASERRGRVETALSAVGLSDRSHHRPDQMSGGQRQRAAIARSIVLDPDLILADEPTGNLDTKTGDEIVALLESLNARGKTLVVVTHNAAIASRARRVIQMVDGRIA